MYQIEDLQIEGRYFADGAIFKTKEDARQQLIDYHSTDMEDEEIETLKKMTLEDILVCFEWCLVEV